MQGERERVAAFCLKMGRSGLTPGTTGNISIADPERRRVAISPSAMEYDRMAPEDVVVLDMDGRRVDGRRRASSEAAMHLACYLDRPDVGAVVHTHSAAATSIAALGRDLPAVHYMLAIGGSSVVRCAPYELFGTAALSTAARAAMGDGFACLLANHGVLARGVDIEHAYSLAEHIEYTAEVYLRASSVGEPKVLSEAQMRQVMASFSKYEPQR